MLGKQIRDARKEAGFNNAEQLAVALGVGIRTVQRWEAGYSEPSIARLIEIAKLTKTTLAELISEDGNHDGRKKAEPVA